MRARAVGLLVAVGVIALACGWYFGTATKPEQRTTVAGGALMFPDLGPRLRDAVKIEVTHQARQTVIEKRAGGGWGIGSINDYPVQDAKLHALLTGLTELRLAEPRTSDPTQFSRLGVDDPNGAGSSANLLRVTDGAGKPILAVIVGHRRVRSQANAPEEVYVRRPDENQSWLAEGNVQADADAALWLDRDVMNIGHDRIASVAVGDGTLVFGRPDGKFALTEPAEHPRLEDYKVENVARALELLTFQEVRAANDAPGTAAGHSVFTTNDGLAVTITVFHADKDVWARFAVSGPSSDKVPASGKAPAATDKAPAAAGKAPASDGMTAAGKIKAEVDRLNGRLAGWSYQIGSWKEKSLVPAIDDLKAEEPAPPAPDADKK